MAKSTKTTKTTKSVDSKKTAASNGKAKSVKSKTKKATAVKDYEIAFPYNDEEALASLKGMGFMKEIKKMVENAEILSVNLYSSQIINSGPKLRKMLMALKALAQAYKKACLADQKAIQQAKRDAKAASIASTDSEEDYEDSDALLTEMEEEDFDEETLINE